MSNIEEFSRVAKEYCEWCLSPPGEEPSEVRTALSLLLRLYSQALALQFPKDMDDDLEGERPDETTRKKVFERAGALPFNNYSSVFDPHVVPPEEPVVGDLADDIADIYRDLFEGLSLYRSGHLAEAEWEFLNSFQSHWGRHASSAIHALDRWFAKNGSW